MKNVKAKSSKWINEQQLTIEKFEYAPFLRNSFYIFHLSHGLKSTVTISVEPMVLCDLLMLSAASRQSVRDNIDGRNGRGDR